jgi:large subunit ribosomal protein L22
VYRYSFEIDPERMASAIGRELPISPKHAVELCRVLRGRKFDDAKRYLQEIIDLKRAVPFKRYTKCVPHRKGHGFGPGRYPRKAAREILTVIETALNNAEYKGLNTDNMSIVHIAAHRGMTILGRMPRARGRATPWNQETVNIEVVLLEEE